MFMFYRLFRKPSYCGIFLDLSLLLTRCKNTTEQPVEEIEQASFTKPLRKCHLLSFQIECLFIFHSSIFFLRKQIKERFKKRAKIIIIHWCIFVQLCGMRPKLKWTSFSNPYSSKWWFIKSLYILNLSKWNKNKFVFKYVILAIDTRPDYNI